MIRAPPGANEAARLRWRLALACQRHRDILCINKGRAVLTRSVSFHPLDWGPILSSYFYCSPVLILN